MALQGTLDTFALPDVLRLLAATKKTGRLRITGGRGTGSVWAAAGEIVGIEATHAPHANEPVDALFELLRFQDGAFTFDAEATHDDPAPPTDVEILLAQAEALLDEWRAIEAVVPSMDAWVTLRPTLPAGRGHDRPGPLDDPRRRRRRRHRAPRRRRALPRRAADLPSREGPRRARVSSSIADDAAGRRRRHRRRPPVAEPPAPAPPAAGRRRGRRRPAAARRPPSGARALAGPRPPRAPAEPEVFVPARPPRPGPGAVLRRARRATRPEAGAEPTESTTWRPPSRPGQPVDARPPVDVDDEELAKQLATLSPRAASAIRAAAEATTDEERDAALDEVDDDDQPLNRGLLLKFLSSVKS